MDPKERLRKLFEKGVVNVDRNIPIQRYFRSGEEMVRMIKVYCEEKQYELAYTLLGKFIILFLEKLKSHPQFKDASPQAKAANKASIKFALNEAESVKSILEEKYQLEYVKWTREQTKLRLLEEERIEQERLKEKHDKYIAQKSLLDKEKEQMDFFVEQQRRKQLERERQELEAHFQSTGSSSNVNGPLIPIDIAQPPNTSAKSTGGTMPIVDRTCKPNLPDSSSAGMKTVSLRHSKYGLRTVTCPHDLPDKFKNCVKSNTDRNVETCGVLFGNLSNNSFVVTHVLIPCQTGTSESCTTTREEDLWEFQEQCSGICLGWIHTHPSQTAFLSSVDLHTHYPYQCLMAESVAIVCSGKFNEVGYFMISPGRGMKEIGSCSKMGHHPHSTNPPLFETCDHVDISTSHSVQLVDWRNRRL